MTSRTGADILRDVQTIMDAMPVEHAERLKEGFTEHILAFCQDRFDTPQEAARFLERFFDMEDPVQKILRGLKP